MTAEFLGKTYEVERDTLPPGLEPGRAHFATSHGGPAEVAKMAHTIASDPAAPSLDTQVADAGGFFHSLFGWNTRTCHEVAAAYAGRGLIDGLRRSRKNVAYVIGSVGFSAEDEQLQFDILSEFIPQLQAEGIRVLVYLSLTNIFWAQVQAAEPQLLERIQQREDGSPFLYGLTREARWLACLVHNKPWLDNVKAKGGMAIRAGADGIFIDNVMHQCYCNHCREYFREFSKYVTGNTCELPAEAEMFETIAPMGKWAGDAETVSAGVRVTEELEAIALGELQRLCQYEILADALQEVRDAWFALKRDCIFAVNNHMHAFINDLGNYLWSQDPRTPGLLEDGRCYCNAPLFRYLQAQGEGWKPISAAGAPCPGGNELALAESAMFGASNYVLGLTPAEMAYERFFADREDVYSDAEPVADTVVLAHDILIQRFPLIPLAVANMMFEVALPHCFTREHLVGKVALVLPDERFLSDMTVEIIREYVDGGGRLVSYGDSSLYDEACRRRDDYGLAEVYGFSSDRRPDGIYRNTYGKGQSLFVPVDVFKCDPVPTEMSEAVLKFVGSDVVSVRGRATVVANVTRSRLSGAIHVHLLNYGNEPAEDLLVRVNVPAAGPGPWEVLTPDGDPYRTVSVQTDGSLHLAAVRTYTILRWR